MGSAATDRISGTLVSTAVKPPCVCVATFNIPLTGLYLLGGRNLAQGDRVLVTAQTSAVDNGIYIADSADWERAADFDGPRDVINGTLVVVPASGGLGMLYQVVSANPIVPGSSPITFLPRDNPNVTYPQTLAELAAGITPANPAYAPGNVLRYGIAPNDVGVAASNTSSLAALLNPSVVGPTGLISFPNTTGSDTYFFGSGAAIQIRDGCVLDLNGCTLNFSGSFNATLNTYGFFTLIRDVTIQNGTIKVNYNGTGGVNNGAAIRFGSKSGYGFGIYPTGIFDQDDLYANGLPLQGNITLRNLRVSSNNPNTHIIFGTGGIRNMTVENVFIDGQGVVPNNGFYYEYGFSSTNGAPSTMSSWSSSHMTASSFRRIVVSNLATGGSSQGFGFNGAYGCTVEDINVLTADQGFGFGTGSAMFYRTWALDGTTRRMLVLSDLKCGACSIGISLGGSNPVGIGYLAAVIAALSTPQQYQAQTDLLSFILDGFSFGTPAGTAIIATGAHVTIRNGSTNGGGINLGAELMRITIENVDIIGASGISIRFNSPGPIWSPARPQSGIIRNNKIIGGASVAIGLAACKSMLIEGNQIGANILWDVANEITQTNGVNIALTSYGVKCKNNYITTASGVGYQNVNNNVDAGNSIENEGNLAALQAGSGATGGGGGWLTDFQSSAAQVIATAGTILVQNLRTVRLAPAAAVTGVIMAAGYASGQTVTLINESASANSITFAASGTSRVAGGTGVVIAGVAKLTLVWDSATNLWY